MASYPETRLGQTHGPTIPYTGLNVISWHVRVWWDCTLGKGLGRGGGKMKMILLQGGICESKKHVRCP